MKKNKRELWALPNRNIPTADRNIRAVSELEQRALDSRSAAERFSDAVVRHAGQVRFVVAHAAWFAVWIVWNSPLAPITPKFDPFPFPALTTVVSLEAIFLSLFILMSENRSTRRADERAHLDLQVNLLAEHESTKTLELVQAICAHLGLPQAADPEVAELLERTEPGRLAREIERQLPTDGNTAAPKSKESPENTEKESHES